VAVEPCNHGEVKVAVAAEVKERLAHLVHQNHEDQYQDKLAQAEVAWYGTNSPT